MYRRHHSQGVSLLEMVVYVAILAVLAVLVVNVVLSLAQSFNSIKASRAINRAAGVSLERMVRDIRNAVATDPAQSTFGVHPGRLHLTSTALSTEFELDGSTLRVRENGVDAGALTTPDVDVTRLVFRRSTSGAIELITIEVTLESTQGPITKTENFYVSAVLRGSY